MVLGTYLYSLIKDGSVTAKIFLMWTYVTRTNVERTNVTVTVGNFYEGPRNLPLKFGPNWVRNS